MGEDKYTVRVTVFTTVGSTRQVVGYDPARVAISFSIGNDPIGPMAISLGWPGGNPEFQIPSTGHLEFTYSHWGPWVAGAWGVTGAGIGVDVFITELLLLER